MNPEEKDISAPKRTTKLRDSKWSKWVWRLVLLFFLLPLLLILLLQVPAVQNWAVDTIASRMSNKLKTEVSVDKVDFSIFRGLEIDGVFIEDNKGDTLLYTEHLKIGLSKSIFSMFSSGLYMDDIELVNGQINIITHVDEEVSNLQVLSAALSSSEEETSSSSGSSLDFDLKKVRLKNVAYKVVNLNTKEKQQYSIADGVVDINKIDLAGNIIDIKAIGLHQPIIIIEKGISQKVAEQEAEEATVEVESVDTSHLLIKVASLEISEGQVTYLDHRKEHSTNNSFDTANMRYRDVELDMQDIQYSTEGSLQLKLKELILREGDDFVLERMKVDSLSVTDRGILLKGFDFKTPNSHIEDDIKLSYRGYDDLSNFAHRVFIKSTFTDASIGSKDLTYFLPALRNSKYFATDANRDIVLDGKITGRLDKMNGRNVSLRIDNRFYLKGNFSGRNITDPDNALFNLKLEQLDSDIQFLLDVVPGFKPPSNFRKIGRFNFQGRFDGYYKDFVAYGKLDSEIGDVDLDMRLDVKNGNQYAEYSGDLKLIDFDLSRWTDNPELGIVNFSTQVSNGKGLTRETAFADLSGRIESMDFRGYTYADFVLDGKIDKNKFDGVFSIDDPNAGLEFDGSVEFKEGTPYLNFKSTIDTLNLKALRLSNEDFTFKGFVDVNMNGNSINNLNGDLLGSKISITKSDTLFTLDTLYVSSYFTSETEQRLNIYSEVGNASLDGRFDYANLVKAARNLIKESYPAYTNSWPMAINTKNQDFDFDFHIIDSKNLLELAGVKGLQLVGVKAKGKFSNEKSEIALTSSIPQVKYNDYAIFGGQLNLNSIGSEGSLFLSIDSTHIGKKKINPIDITSKIMDDSISVQLQTANIVDSIENLNLTVGIVPHDKGLQFHLSDDGLVMLGNQWDFSPNNKIVLGDKYIDIENLYLTDNEKKIIIKDIDEQGIELDLENIDLAMANPFINYEEILFGGLTNIEAKVFNMYSDKPTITGNVHVEDFLMNDEDFGTLIVDLSKENNKPYAGLISLVHQDHELKSHLSYDDKTKYLDLNATSKKLPLRILEFVIGDGVSEVAGGVDAQLKLSGHTDSLDLTGQGMLYDGAAKVDYLGAKFFFDNQPLTLTREFIDLTGDIITDMEGNEAVITGGLRHDLFSDFRMDLNISGDNVIVLNTTKRENPLYFGRLQGKLSVDFASAFDRAEITVNATTGPTSQLNIPVTNYQDGIDESFIKFVDRDNLDSGEISIINSNDDYLIKGLNLRMNVTLTDDALLRIIFDERKGDIVEGRGDGDIQMNIDRFGAFEVFGEYEISSGDYLFTAGIVRKKFRVQPGGTIRWQGDPLNALLDIDAEYVTRTSLSGFLAEYITPGTTVEQEASSSQETILTLDLNGTLFEPRVNFDIEFPDLTGELRTLAQNKLRTLKTNQLALNNQVVGLLVANTFLTTNNVSGAGTGQFFTNAGVNTVSELLSNQLSNLLTGLLTEALSDNGLISGIDFNVGLRNNAGLLNSEVDNGIGINEMEVNMRNRFAFLNERLSLSVGGNFVNNDQVAGVVGNYVAGNLVLEYYLTDARQLKLRLYTTSDIDYQEQGRRGRYGVGVAYRTEFGSLSDFQNGLNDVVKKLIESEEE